MAARIYTPDELKKYALTARRLARARRAELEARRQRALTAAQQSAKLLKSEFGVKRVVLFGSLAREPGAFSERSDIDLAVWGLAEHLYFRALRRLHELNSESEVDLVEFEFARPQMRRAIEREGVDL